MNGSSLTRDDFSPDISLFQRQWLPLEEAIQRVAKFEHTFGNAHLLLACHAALSSILTPDLVNLIRINFLEKSVEWIAESDLLLSSLCYPINQGVFEFESRIRSVLLIVLQNEEPPGTERLKEIASFLHAYASQSFPPEKDISEERKRTYQWISDAYLAPDVVVQSMFDLLRGTALEDSASRIRNYRLVGKMLAMLIDSLSRTNLQVELEDVVDSASLIWQSDEDLLTLLQKNRDMFDETTQILTCAVADWLLHGSPSSQSKDKESWIIRAHCSRQ